MVCLDANIVDSAINLRPEQIHVELETAGAPPIARHDYLIATQDRRQAALVTHGRHEFHHVPGLIVVGWAV